MSIALSNLMPADWLQGNFQMLAGEMRNLVWVNCFAYRKSFIRVYDFDWLIPVP